MSQEVNYLAAFEKHGFEQAGRSGDQLFGDCPFCGRTKFYLNPTNGLWSCKAGSCGRSGNLSGFLEQVAVFYQQATPERMWGKLETDRRIARETFIAAGIGYNPNLGWLIPVRDSKGHVQDLRYWKPGRKVMSTKGCFTQLFGAENLPGADGIVYLCEGEWDTLSFRELLADYDDGEEALPEFGEVVGTPGAETFKASWVPLFQGRDVVILYDNDKAGRDGAAKITGMLAGVAESVRHLEWPDDLPAGYDIRDLVTSGDVCPRDQVLNWVLRRSTDQAGPSRQVAGESARNRTLEAENGTAAEGLRDDEEPIETFDEVLKEYTRWLRLDEDAVRALRIVFAVVLSQRLEGDPLWIFLVAPPGGLKSELVTTLSTTPNVILRSTISPQALISGWNGPGGSDPSLLPRLNGKTFVLKDFTELRALHKDTRAEVYGILRGAYDGHVEKSYGNGIFRHYQTHFSVVAGATQDIHGDTNASLGERFLKFQMVKGVGFDASDNIRRALSNVTKEAGMRAELASVARRFLAARQVSEDSIPDLSKSQAERLVALAQFVAMLRGTVDRDPHERITYRPQHEVGTRIAKQLKKMALALALVAGSEDVIPEDCYNIIEQIALDTCIGINLEIFGHLREKALTVGELADRLGIPSETLYVRLQDQIMLGVLERFSKKAGRGRPTYYYRASETARALWRRAKVKARIFWVVSRETAEEEEEDDD